MTVLYSSNDVAAGFDPSATGAIAPNWASKQGTWQVGTSNLVGSHTHSFGSTTKLDGDVALLTGVTARAHMSLGYLQKVTSLTAAGGTPPALGPVLRMDPTYSNGYVVVFQAGFALWLFKRTSGYFTAIGTSVTPAATFSVGDFMGVRAEAIGTTIRVRLWNATTGSEGATWDVSVTDSSVGTAGFPGLYHSTNSTPALTLAVTDVVVSDTAVTQSVTVTTPSTQTAGAAMTVSGTYANGTPTALDYQIDGGAWTAATSPAISAGTFSFSITAPAAGSHTIGVRDKTTLVSGTSGSFSTTSGRTITVTTPSGWNAASTVTVSGTYGGTAPAGINYQIDAVGYTAASSPTIGGGNFSFSITAPSAGSHTISV